MQRIETKRQEAFMGGGQKRMDTQHNKVIFLKAFTKKNTMGF